MALPSGWRRVHVRDLARDNEQPVLTGPFGTNIGKGDFVSEGCPVLTIGCLTDAGINPGKAMFVKMSKAEELDRYRLREGDLLFSRMASVGRAGMVPRSLEGALFNYHIMRLRLSDALMLPELFMAYVRGAPEVHQYLEEVNHGATRDGINTTQLLDMPVSLPPLNEQRRIVAKLEALQTRSRRARDALDAVPLLLEKLRQSILAAAFRGDLTADWRAQNPNTEPASALLARIRTERRKKWEEAELAKLKAKGKAPTDDKWKAKYRQPEPVDAQALPELPHGWCWASVDEVLSDLRNGISAKPDQDSGLRILRISAVRPLRVNTDDVRFLAPTREYSEYELADGDLLLTRYNGNPELVGVAGVARGLLEPTVYPDKLIRATPVEAVVSSDFLAIALNTGFTRKHIAERGKSAAGQVGVSGSDIKSAPIPVPPKAEQDALVRAVNASLVRVGNTRDTAEEALRALDRLDRATLAKAFRGELVPQDPSDEPADITISRAAGTSAEAPRQRGRRAKAAE